MCRNYFLRQKIVLAKAYQCNGLFYKKYGKWTSNVKSKVPFVRTIAEMTNVPFESTFNKVVLNSYETAETEVPNKVTVVGTGEAAMASTFALLAKKITNDVCLIDVNDNKLQGEQMDLEYGAMFLNNPNITASKEHQASANSKICVVAAGTEQGKNENEYEFTARNTEIIRAVVPQLMKYSPDAVYLVASDPVDVLTYQAWRAGGMNKSRIIGTGTNLDSARLRYLMGDRMGIDPSSCLGLVVGRNPCNPCNPCGGGRGGVPVWSEVAISGIRLMELNSKIGTKDDPDSWEECYEHLLKEEQEIRKLKGGYTWALALSIVDICEAILTNSHSVRTVSTYAKGEYNITDDVFISLPCVLGINGITDIVRQPLSTSETTFLRKSARSVTETQEVLKILQ